MAEKATPVFERVVVQHNYDDPRAPEHVPPGRGGDVVEIKRVGYVIVDAPDASDSGASTGNWDICPGGAA